MKTITDWIAEFGLDAHRERITASSRPGFRLRVTRDAGEFDGSRFGGSPLLAGDEPWPTRDGRSLTFLGQIRFDECLEPDAGPNAPRFGVLGFFYDTAQMPAEDESTYIFAFRVIHTPDNEDAAVRRPPPDAEVLPSRGMDIASVTTIPPPFGAAVSCVVAEMTLSERGVYSKMWQAMHSAEATPAHQFLGHSSNLDGDMQHNAYLASQLFGFENDISFYDPEFDDPFFSDRCIGAGTWRLLAQFDSDNSLGLRFPGGGRLYFWIDEAMLDWEDFSEVWCVRQSRTGSRSPARPSSD